MAPVCSCFRLAACSVSDTGTPSPAVPEDGLWATSLVRVRTAVQARLSGFVTSWAPAGRKSNTNAPESAKLPDGDGGGSHEFSASRPEPMRDVTNEVAILSKPSGVNRRAMNRSLEVVDVFQMRSGLGLSRAEFARFFGVSEATVVRWESDRGLAEPKGLQAVLLSAVSDAAKRHGGERVARVLRSCSLDHRKALRALLDLVD